MDSVTGRIKEARKMGGRKTFFFPLLLPFAQLLFFLLFLTAIVSGGYKRRSCCVLSGAGRGNYVLCSTKKVSQVSTHRERAILPPPFLHLWNKPFYGDEKKNLPFFVFFDKSFRHCRRGYTYEYTHTHTHTGPRRRSNIIVRPGVTLVYLFFLLLNWRWARTSHFTAERYFH